MKQLVTRAAALVLLGFLSFGCSSESTADKNADSGGNAGSGGNGGSGGNADSGVHDGAATGHSLTLSAALKPVGSEVPFITPSVSVIKVPVANIVGKPYLVTSFPAGFSPGNDPPIDYVWGDMPADLTVRYTTPSTYKDGPYDMTLLVYINTPIPDSIKKGSPQFAPAPKGGDLATFTADMGDVRPGDPSIPAGLVRLNVEGANAQAAVENKVPADPTQPGPALINTVMIIP